MAILQEQIADRGGKLLLKADEVAHVLNLGRSKVYEMMASGELPTLRIGRAVRVSSAELQQWVRKQSGQQ